MFGVTTNKNITNKSSSTPTQPKLALTFMSTSRAGSWFYSNEMDLMDNTMLSERSMLRQTMLREMLKHLHWRNLQSNRTCDPCKTGWEGHLALPAPLT